MTFHSNENENDLKRLEKYIFPTILCKTEKDRRNYERVKSLFKNAFKTAKLNLIQRFVIWRLITKALRKGIKEEKSLYEIEQPLRAFFKKRIDFEKQTKPATIKRSENNYRKISSFILGDKILDLGAGDGLLAKQIRDNMNKEVTLVDVVDYNFTDLPLLLYDQMGNIPLDENSVDTTILYTVLHHADDPLHVLSEACRVSSKRLIILEGYIEEEEILVCNAFIDWYFNRVIRDADINVPLNYAKLEEWRSYLDERGFEITTDKYLGIDEPVAPEHHMLIVADIKVK